MNQLFDVFHYCENAKNAVIYIKDPWFTPEKLSYPLNSLQMSLTFDKMLKMDLTVFLKETIVLF